jgi:hypothetical protein
MAESNAAAALQNVYKTPELWQKIVFTFICLVIYRTGAHVTAPGVDVAGADDYFASQRGGAGILGLYDLFVGGGLSRRDGVRPRHHAVHLGEHLRARSPAPWCRRSTRCRRTRRAGRS